MCRDAPRRSRKRGRSICYRSSEHWHVSSRAWRSLAVARLAGWGSVSSVSSAKITQELLLLGTALSPCCQLHSSEETIATRHKGGSTVGPQFIGGPLGRKS